VVLDFAEERSVVQTRFATSSLALMRVGLGEDLTACIADAETALRSDALDAPERFERFVFLGHGWTVGLAEEGALKLQEAAGMETDAFPAMEFRHGPISRCDERSFVWILGSPDEAVADDVRATGASVRVGSLDPMAELVMVQRLAVMLAESRGLDPDRPRHLTRSVVLSGAVAGEGKDRMNEETSGGTR
jgi:fructoselysine-6-P-deglycase FrlB-like protein